MASADEILDPLPGSPSFLRASTDSELRSEVITNFADLEMLSPHWERLWRTNPVGEIFQSPSWNRAWWRGYGSNVNLHCIVVWRGNLVVGLLPLVSKDRTLRFLGAPQGDYGDCLIDDHQAPSVLSAILTTLLASPNFKGCVLEHLSSASCFLSYFHQLPSDMRRCMRLVKAGHAPTILIGNNSEYLASLAAKKHLRRREIKLDKCGGIEFNFLQTRNEIREHLPAFFRHQIRRRILQGQESSCLQPEFSKFLQALVEELDPAHYLRFGILRFNNQPAAYHLGFLSNGKFTMYQQAFDVDLWDYSPGEVLLRQLFLYARQNVSREFDFSVGEEPYKARFANHFKPNFTLYIEPRTFEGRSRHLYRGLAGEFVKLGTKARLAVKSNSNIYSWAKYLRQWSREYLKCSVAPRIYRHKQLLDSSTEGGSQLFVRTIGTKGASFPCSVQLKKMRLSELADFYLECPHFPLATRMAEYRERLRKGGNVLLLRIDGGPAALAWTKTRPIPDAASPTPPGPTTVYDCTFLNGNRQRTREILFSLLWKELLSSL